MRTALYVRVSTADQTTENQILALQEVATQRGWTIVRTYEDAGISGAKGRDARPALDRMLKDAARGKFDLIAVWSIDRLGRSLSDLVTILSDLGSVRFFSFQQALDTTTPSGRAMFQMVGVFAEFERAMIRERVNAGLQRARARGKKLGPRFKVKAPVRDHIRWQLANGWTRRQLADENKVSVETIRRIENERAEVRNP